MTSRDFCYWLQGFFELNGNPNGQKIDGELVDSTGALTCHQADTIRRHLALVFKHEIDPSYGPPEHLEELNKIHSPGVHEKDCSHVSEDKKPLSPAEIEKILKKTSEEIGKKSLPKQPFRPSCPEHTAYRC